jgi:hypothetical protein
VTVQASSPEARRLLEAFEMNELGLRILRARLRRDDPAASDDELDALVRAWSARGASDGSDRPIRPLGR